jgi:hypothetical protein
MLNMNTIGIEKFSKTILVMITENDIIREQKKEILSELKYCLKFRLIILFTTG